LVDGWWTVRVDELEASVPSYLLRGFAGIVTPALVRVCSSAIGAHHPDEVGDGIDQRTQFVFGVLAFSDIAACTDEILDLPVGITMGGNRHQNIQIQVSSWMDSGLKAYGFSQAGSPNGCAQLLLDRGVR